MNLAHVHLLLNHIPVIAIPIGLLFLLHSIWTENLPARKFSYLFLLVISLSAIVVYLTGEPAEEIIEHLPGVSEAFIEPHEEGGLIALIFTLIMGFAATVALLVPQEGKKSRFARNAVLVTTLLSIGALSYTAYLGGKLRCQKT